MGLVPACLALPVLGRAQEAYKPGSSFPSQDPARISAIVGASHGDIDKVRELLAESPALARASWDWGFGDWESALGAASHMGRRDMADVLIANGARPDVFTFAMMGNLDAVKATVQGIPGSQKLLGPHDITLLAHAKNGGDPAKPVVEYLESLGDADQRPAAMAITEEEKAAYLGHYRFGPAADEVLEVGKNNQGNLMIRRGQDFGRGLRRVTEHEFAPGGAKEVRIRFKVESGKAVALSVHDPLPLVTATRI